jgi:hypothetical protein
LVSCCYGIHTGIFSQIDQHKPLVSSCWKLLAAKADPDSSANADTD